MKRIAIFIALIICVSVRAQDRVDAAPEQLSWKSQAIDNALFWEQNKNGKWVSRKNTKKPYHGEGVAIENFNTTFTGVFRNVRYLFIDAFGYRWRYPNLEMEWMYEKKMYAFELTDSDYSNLQNLKEGETVSVMTKNHNDMFVGHDDYSFPFFLRLTDTLRGTEETPQYAICAKRTKSNGTDVVRFLIAPTCLPDLIDTNYFEVSYDTFQRLFTQDKKNTYK